MDLELEYPSPEAVSKKRPGTKAEAPASNPDACMPEHGGVQLQFYPSQNNSLDQIPIDEQKIEPKQRHKFTHNREDGGRRRNVRHVSRYEFFKDTDVLKGCSKDLFGAKAQRGNPSSESEETSSMSISNTI